MEIFTQLFGDLLAFVYHCFDRIVIYGYLSLSQVTLLPPITDPDKIICAGRNYRAHAAEAGGPPPENPQVFLRLVNTLVAHDQPMMCPRISGDFDYEGELAVIHRQARPPHRQIRCAEPYLWLHLLQ
jgi:2-keto-4-pentenoate hydratase/2-oxohepta-3-ene-1,7-dioic acid hydratase in catechol pathway